MKEYNSIVELAQVMQEERRQTKRIAVKDRILCFKLFDREGLLKVNDLPMIIGMRNISFGGIGGLCNRKCNPGDRLAINLVVGEDKLRFDLQVRWCNDQFGYYHIGFKFIQQTENKIRFLNRYIEHVVKR